MTRFATLSSWVALRYRLWAVCASVAVGSCTPAWAAGQSEQIPQPPPAASQTVPEAHQAQPDPSDPLYRSVGDHERSYSFLAGGGISPYRLYVPTDWKPERPMGMVVILHGGRGNQDGPFDEAPAGHKGELQKLADQHGLIVLAPYGYRGQWGSDLPLPPPPPGVAPPGATLPQAIASGNTRPSSTDHGPEADRIRHLGEQDVLNIVNRTVLEYGVDRKRLYLMGNSGGAIGTMYLAQAHPQLWAAIAPSNGPVESATFPFARLQGIQGAFVIHGAQDRLTVEADMHTEAERIQAQGIETRYLNVPGAGHGDAFYVALPEVFNFFDHHVRASSAPSFSLTWIAVTTWLIETGGKRILVDGFLTRPAPFANPGDVEGSFRAVKSDVSTVDAIIGAITHGDQHIDYILSGHAHIDHSLDIPMIAKKTGAIIIGSPTTCFQAQGEGITASQCRPVNGGEVIDLGTAQGTQTKLYVIHGNHSGAGDTALHTPLELSQPITVDPPGSVEGAIRPGVHEQMPNGGGTRAFLIKTAANGAEVSLSVETSGSASDFDLPVKVRTCVGEEPRPCSKDIPGAVYPSPASAFAAALQASGLSRVDLMIGMGGGPAPRADAPQSPEATLTVKEAQILHPRYFLPTHWNSTPAPILKGLDRPYKPDPALSQWLAAHDVRVAWPTQFFDRWVLDTSGLHVVDNHEVKARLGLADVQVFDTVR